MSRTADKMQLQPAMKEGMQTQPQDQKVVIAARNVSGHAVQGEVDAAGGHKVGEVGGMTSTCAAADSVIADSVVAFFVAFF